MGGWNLRRVMVETPHSRAVSIREVYYDEQGRPWTYFDARLIDIIRFHRDWRKTLVLRFPEDFNGE
jgi:hypothetical protein